MHVTYTCRHRNVTLLHLNVSFYYAHCSLFSSLVFLPSKEFTGTSERGKSSKFHYSICGFQKPNA